MNMKDDILHYVESRIDVYLDRYRERIKRDETLIEEIRELEKEKMLYDNIIELCSLCDYIYLSFPFSIEEKIQEMKEIHKNRGIVI